MHPTPFLVNTVIIYFLFKYLIIGVRCSTYLGCFKENSPDNRLLKGDHTDFRGSLTHNKCISHCAKRGFTYIGLQFKYECFCSNDKPSQKYSTHEIECDMTCEGNSKEICGGALRLSVHLIADLKENSTEDRLLNANAVNSRGVPSKNYVGCYKDRSIEARLMPDVQKDFRNTLTSAKCISYCKELDFEYAGLQNSYECFCTNLRPSFKETADERDCYLECEGDPKQICGGSWRLSVYEASETHSNFVQSNYLGCYTDNSENRLLELKHVYFPNKLTPEICVGYCYRRGYRFAAVQSRTQCFCGNDFNEEQKVEEEECNYRCANSRFFCGGLGKSSVYETQISDYPEDGKLLGCFKDEEELRVLSALMLTYYDTNTPKLCFNVCLQLGYKYSGVEDGRECHCGNRRPSKGLEVAESQCLMPCSGDRRESCGGAWRILVYSVTALSDSQSITTRRTITTRPPTSFNSNIDHPDKSCEKSLTELNKRTVCKGDTLFKEDFENEISSDKWAHEIKMPLIPDYEFVTFQKKSRNAFVQNGKLYIKPTLQDDEFVRRGRLELQGCTGIPFSEECVRQAATFSILPPVESARITTLESITFKYGIVQVRARLPVGDWIVPEIWLEPKRRVYGPALASGRVRIAMARGNKNLMSGDQNIGVNRLESGVLMGIRENIRSRTILREKPEGWHKQFHNYTLIWTPDSIRFLVDGEPDDNTLNLGSTLSELLEFEEDISDKWRSGTKIAPFDQEFYLSLGVSVGGMRDFPDDSTSSGKQKPWRNMAVKAMLNFWKDRNNWLSTWDEWKSTLQIEDVRIIAL